MARLRAAANSLAQLQAIVDADVAQAVAYEQLAAVAVSLNNATYPGKATVTALVEAQETARVAVVETTLRHRELLRAYREALASNG